MSGRVVGEGQRLRFGDWATLLLLRRAHGRHVRTDPACIQYTAPKSGSRLDAASRGMSCWQCIPAPSVCAGGRCYCGGCVL